MTEVLDHNRRTGPHLTQVPPSKDRRPPASPPVFLCGGCMARNVKQSNRYAQGSTRLLRRYAQTRSLALQSGFFAFPLRGSSDAN